MLFDALETELLSTAQTTLLERTYRGELADCVQCTFCMYQSKRPSRFDDLNLAIRSFGLDPTLYSSIEQVRMRGRLR